MKIAIVGCGQIADAHIQEARRIPGVSVVAVCDTNVHMAEQAAVRFGIPGMYTNLIEMLTTVKPDVVHVATPPSSHLSVAQAALEHGAHAYVEKPLTVMLKEAEELSDVAKRQGRLVCVGHSCPFDSAFLRMKDLYGNGALGNIVHLEAVMSYDLSGPFGAVFMKDPMHWLHRLPGGLAHNNISHPLSLILTFLPDLRPAVSAYGRRRRTQRYGDIRDRFQDEIRVNLTGHDVTASLVFSCQVRPVQLSLALYGSRAQANVSLGGGTLHIVDGATLPEPLRKLQWARRDALRAKREYWRHIGSLLRARLYYFEGMRELFRRFFLAIEGKGELPVPMSEAIRTTAIMEAIFQQCQDRLEEQS